MKQLLPIFLIIIVFCNGCIVSATIIQENLSDITNNDEMGRLLIITPDYFSNALQPLIDHKEVHGIKTKIETLDNILESNETLSGRDDAEIMKYYIKSALQNWNASYVLIVGGRKQGFQELWHAPVRYVTVNAWNIEKYSFISDLYFADIYDDDLMFQSWDTNDDNLFGTEDDTMDLRPDVLVGRWACRNEREVKKMVEKTIAYESNYELRKKIVLVGGDTFVDSTNYDEGELITSESARYCPEYEIETVFSSETSVSSKEIRNALGMGASFMHFSGHAWVTYWNTYKHDNIDKISEPGLGIWDVPFFKNTQYPIVVIGGCNSAKFDTSITEIGSFLRLNIEQFDLPFMLKITPPIECLSWSLTHKNDGGAIATIGYTCSPIGVAGEHGDKDHDGIVEPDCVEYGYGYIENLFFYAHGKEEKTYLGECWKYAEDVYYETFDSKDPYNFLVLGGFVVLGDPSLKIGGYPK